jgi:hypothetical protein
LRREVFKQLLVIYERIKSARIKVMKAVSRRIKNARGLAAIKHGRP